MAKPTKRYKCSDCSAVSPKWIGKCPQCSAWNTYQEEWVSKDKGRQAVPRASGRSRPVIALRDIPEEQTSRIQLPDLELTRALGGGVVAGSVVLLAGQPGIGKSTLLLQVACQSSLRILYVSGEESPEQIRLRAERIGLKNPECYLLDSADVHFVLDRAEELTPELIIVDSIQTMSVHGIDAPPGSVSQIRESTQGLIKLAKSRGIPVMLIGHITKDGAIAGPKLLEHMVDVVLQFEGEQQYNYRLLRTVKNRFGSTDELGIYEMTAQGLTAVDNPSAMFVSQNTDVPSGSAVAATVEGMRPLLIETQALVSTAVFGTPQRNVTGYDLRRLNMLLAVLEKRAGIPFSSSDVFLNLAGGLRIADPAIDLAVLAALVSSREDIAIGHRSCFAGEISLAGEVRAVRAVGQRIQEAERLGMRKFYLSPANAKALRNHAFGIELQYVQDVRALLEALFA